MPVHLVAVKRLAFLCSLLWLLDGISRSNCKVIRGITSSLEAWEEKGQYLTKFCFHDKNALFKFTTNASSPGKLYFYLDETWAYAYGEQDCARKIALAKFSRNLEDTSGEQYLNQWIRPHFWFVVYADSHTCNLTTPPYMEGVAYEMIFLNPDSYGNASDHFGDDLRGLLTFYCLLIVLYVGGVCLYAHKVLHTLSKGGPMHEVLKMLSVAMALHFCAALLMCLHLWRYSANGEGLPIFEIVSEALEVLAQCQMIWLLLSMSVGWTLGSSTAHPIKDKNQLYTIGAVALFHILLVIWEQSYDESYYTYHVHESLPGLLLVVLRLSLAGLFGYNLKSSFSKERSTLRKDFYQRFAVGCYIWFLAFPLLMSVAMVFAEYWRHKVVTVGVTIIQTVAMGWLSRLFLTRSLYWEVSTLSSTTLPLRLDRGGGGGVWGYLTKYN